jgi:hypothetical protein
MAHSVLLRIRNVSDKSWKKIKTHILCSITFFQTSCHLRHNAEKFTKGREATDDNMVQAHFTLGTQGYKLTLSEYVIPIPFLLQESSMSVPQCYIICTLPVSFPVQFVLVTIIFTCLLSFLWLIDHTQ